MKQNLRKFFAGALAGIFLLANSGFAAAITSLATGADTLSESTKSAASAHSIAFTTAIALETGDKIRLFFPDFEMNLDSADNISTTSFAATADYSNSAKTVELILTENFSPGAVEIQIAADKITNPAVEGEYSISILTLDSSDDDATLDSGIAKAGVENEIHITINIGAVISNVTSLVDDGTFHVGGIIPISLSFTGPVFVTGTPEIALNNGGTAFYSSGSGTSTLIFNYEIADTSEYTGDIELDYSSTAALTLADGTIRLSNDRDAILILPEPGESNSLGFNKNIFIRGSRGSSFDPPFFANFEIVDEDGTTNDSTPELHFETYNFARRFTLSCDGGVNWTPWAYFPGDGEIVEFDILSCGAEEGIKTISARIANTRGEEAEILSDSTIYQKSSTAAEGDDLPSPSSENAAEEDTSDDGEITGDEIVEIGYFDEFGIWRSFPGVEPDADGNFTVVDPEHADDAELRIIPAERLEDFRAVGKLSTTKPVFAKIGGEILIDLQLKNGDAVLDISAGTRVVDSSGANFAGVIFAPTLVPVPPPPPENLESSAVYSVGASSGSLNFDRPIRLALPVPADLLEPQIYYFDEIKNEWRLAVDVTDSNNSGGVLAEDGAEISIWLDHLTIFAVFGKRLNTPKISRIAAGADSADRASFSSGEWLNSAELARDGTLSFSWSGAGENFYFALDDNPFATSLAEISDSTDSTSNFFIDGLSIAEGENFFHLVAENSEKKRSEESIFVVNFDATPPQLTGIKSDENKLKLIFSEKVTTVDETILYFENGESLVLPTQKIGSATIEVDTEIASDISATVGMFVDRAGLVVINPRPSQFSGELRDANLTLLFPTKIVDGKFFTRENSARVRPTATGATKLRLAANLLDADDWRDFSENEVAVPLEYFGAQKILFEFSNDAGEREVAGAIVARVPADSDEFAEMQKKQIATLADFRAELATKIKSWFVWGLDPQFAELIDSINPAALDIDSENLDSEKVDDLNRILADAEKIRALAGESDPDFREISALAEELAESNFSLADFLSFAEINSLLAAADSKTAARLAATLDQNSVAVRIADDTFAAAPLSLGMRDSDDDGLADLFEIEFGTDPFSADSDGDGFTDSAEIFELGRDPLVADFTGNADFVGLVDGAILSDPRPFFAGVADAGQIVKIVATDSNGAEILLGEAVADARGSFKILSEISLPAGEYKLQLKSGSQILATREVEINLDFIIFPPRIYVSENEIFAESRPAFFGSSFYRGRVVASFDGVSTAIVVDNSAGDFVLRPPQNLKNGRHSLVFFVELVDGTRSPARALNFEIVESKLRSSALKIENIDLRKVAVGGGTLFAAGIFGIWIFRRRRI